MPGLGVQHTAWCPLAGCGNPLQGGAVEIMSEPREERDFDGKGAFGEYLGYLGNVETRGRTSAKVKASLSPALVLDSRRCKPTNAPMDGRTDRGTEGWGGWVGGWMDGCVHIIHLHAVLHEQAEAGNTQAISTKASHQRTKDIRRHISCARFLAEAIHGNLDAAGWLKIWRRLF